MMMTTTTTTKLDCFDSLYVLSNEPKLRRRICADFKRKQLYNEILQSTEVIVSATDVTYE